MREQFVQRLKDELNKAALRRPVRRLLGELARPRIEIDVAPETTGKLGHVDAAIRLVVQGGEGLQGEADTVLGAGKAYVTLEIFLPVKKVNLKRVNNLHFYAEFEKYNK